MSLEFRCPSCHKDLMVSLGGTETITECPFCKARLSPTSVKLAQGLTRGLTILAMGFFAGGIVFVLLVFFVGDNANAWMRIEALTLAIAAYIAAGVAVVAMIAMFVYYNLAIARGPVPAGLLAVPREPLIQACSSCHCFYAWQPGPEVRAPDCPKCRTASEPQPGDQPGLPRARAVLMPPTTTGTNVQIGITLVGSVVGVIVLGVSICMGSSIGTGIGIALLIVAVGALIYGSPGDIKKAKELLAAAGVASDSGG